MGDSRKHRTVIISGNGNIVAGGSVGASPSSVARPSTISACARKLSVACSTDP